MIRRALIALIAGYRRFLSPLKPPCCRFVPTCSQYGLDALREHGAVVGLALLAWRLLRCHPFCEPGFDPVPPRRTGRRHAHAGLPRPDERAAARQRGASSGSS